MSKEDHASGLGFARAIKTVRQHVDMESVITHLMTCGKYSVTPNTPQSTRATMYHFDHDVVYDPTSGNHVNRTPIPAQDVEKVKAALGGDLSQLGHIWSARIAHDMANSIIHPLTRVPFVVPSVPTTVSRGGQRASRTVLVGGRIKTRQSEIVAGA